MMPMDHVQDCKETNRLPESELMIRVFGNVGLDGPTGPIDVGGPRQRRMLALLLTQAGSVGGNHRLGPVRARWPHCTARV